MAVWWRWLLPAILCSPWLTGIAYYWRRRPRDGALPLSHADQYVRRG